MDTVRIDKQDFIGVSEIVEFVNEDGKLQQYNCGQAAATTLINFHQVKTSVLELEKLYPPDAMFGWFGTSKRRLEKALKGYGLQPKTIEGAAAVKDALTNGIPGLVLCEFVFREIAGIKIPSGHWMVAFGYDNEHIYLSNWTDNRMTWEEFEKNWKGLVPRYVSMEESMIIVE